ncbi:MAG TPA: discoidin domain-containing protein [Chthoniobacteraceae bacterium]|nr:discoidin domain-containing protein [Chthoniobacteraceae bacterium]
MNSLKIPLLLLLAAGCATSAGVSRAQTPLTFCNPMNLDYGPYAKGSRHGADPVIVLFKGKYYLFDTDDKPGYRVSDDLVHWSDILFDPATLALATTPKGDIIAPAAYTDGKYLYYVVFGGRHILRTADPASGHWDDCAQMSGGAGDPDLFLDDDGKVYMIGGLGEVTIWQLNPGDFSTVKGSRFDPIPNFKTLAAFIAAKSPYGLYYGHNVYNHLNWNLRGTLDTSGLDLSAQKSGVPTMEGNWMTKYRGRYYLQDANPDTSCPWYSDSVWEADSINGPYKFADYSPGSMKVGGFINSAGHSCLFQDKYGNWWRVTTLWIGVYAGFERRVGLFPAGFDDKGRLFTRTDFGDYPVVVPNGPFDANKQSPLAGWYVLSTGKTCTASTTLDSKHAPEMAADENVRTWWSAKTGDKGEWFQMDLGKLCTVNAVQVNFAEQDCKNDPASEDYTAYQLLASQDGNHWTTVIDKAGNQSAAPHDYVPFATPLKARYLKVVNVHAAKLGKFALRDLRVFGNGGGTPPARIAPPAVTRGNPAWNVTFRWNPSSTADGYMIRYGVAPDALHLSIQVQGGGTGKLTVSCVDADVKYYYRVDSYNDSGITEGLETVTPQ